MSTHHARTTDAAKGKWKGILLSLGLPSACLQNKHGPCPLCDGTDRFRWDNQEGKGTYICGQCGAGTGMDLAIAFTGRAFPDIASEIDTLLGNKKFAPDEVPVQISDADRLTALRSVAAQSVKLTSDTLGHVYFTSRGIGEKVYPKSLRYVQQLRDGSGGIRPCVVATVQGPDGANVTLHRTFLRGDGLAKADMAAPRKLMPGSLPEGSAVRLSDWNYGALGIAEGIETAMSASRLYDMPVWAAINSSMLEKWQPPEGCDEVAIFGDHDAKFGGQASAYRLAHRLAVKGMRVTVHIPQIEGHDWNDALLLARPVGDSKKYGEAA
jgi:putative DNA primase/helicase